MLNPDGSTTAKTSDVPFLSEQLYRVGGVYGQSPHYGFPSSENSVVRLLTLEERADALAESNHSGDEA